MVKINKISTSSSKRIASLFLMGLLSANGAGAGEGFRNCIGSQRYDSLTNTTTEIKDGETWVFCIEEDSILPKTETGACRFNPFYCNKIGENVYCLMNDCGGLVGDALIKFNSSIYYNETKCRGKFFNYLDLEKPTLYEKMEENIWYYHQSFCPVKKYLNLANYAYWWCALAWKGSTFAPYCHWDSGGWTCVDYGYLRESTSNKFPSDLACYFQWKTFDGYFEQVINSKIVSPATLPPPPNNSNFTEKLAIPIASTVGVISVGGVTYYIISKNKKNLNDILNSINGNLTSEQINTKIGELDQYRNSGQRSLKKIIWNHSKAERVYDKLIAKQEKPILESIIGKGGFGEVYKGKWKLQEVAVKKLNLNSYNISETDIKNFKKEVNILKSLKNKYIIQYYGVYFDDQELLIIMEYAEKSSLTNFINNNQDKEHDWDLNTNLIKQMALGLAYIHRENIIHCDLKSLNILLTSGSEVKISDFGLSKTKIVSASQSKNLGVIGTLRWVAPEVIRGEQKYSEQSDIYSLGMVIWEIAAKCTTPFENVDYNLVHIRIINGGKETIPDDTPKDVRDIIKGCWENNPSERITLKRILEIIGTRELELQNANSNNDRLLDNKKALTSPKSEEINEETFASESLKIDFVELKEGSNQVTDLDNYFELKDKQKVVQETHIEQPPK